MQAAAASAATSMKPVRTSSKSKEVFERLRIAIVSRQLEPGHPLKEAVLASQMQVSQVPVREALLKLEAIGLVRRVPDRGTHVTSLSRDEMIEMVEVRAHLEDLAFRLAAKRITKEQIAKLRSAAKKLNKSAEANQYFASAEADLAFHRTVWKASGNNVLARTLEQLCIPFYAFVSQQRREHHQDLPGHTSDHDLLIDALLTKDEEVISSAVRGHVNERSCLPFAPS